MRFLTSILNVGAFAAITILPDVMAAPASNRLEQRDDSYVGYLLTTFSDATPAIQLHLSTGNDPGSYSFLNGGKPVLTSTVGTKAVRDVFLTHDSARSTYYIIATGKRFGPV